MCKLDEARFHNDDAARKYHEATLWPNGPVCPHCGTIGIAYSTKKQAFTVAPKRVAVLILALLSAPYSSVAKSPCINGC